MHTSPFLRDSFPIAWSQLSPDRALSDIRQAIQLAQAAVDKIAQLPLDQLSYENTFAALEDAPAPLHRAWQRLSHLRSVNDSPESREIVAQLLPEVSSFSASLTLNPQLYAVLKAAASAPWVATLSPVKQRFIQETMLDFKESGADLNEADKARYVEIVMELAELSESFGQKALDATNAWEYVCSDSSELKGLPESAMETARLDALAKGYGSEEAPAWRFNLQVTSLMPVLTYADCVSLRERVWRANASKMSGDFDTASLIERILSLREQKALLLDFACYGDYALSRRMAGSGRCALDFIDTLHAKVYPAFVKEQEDLRLFAQEASGEELPVMEPWSVAYWSEKRRQALFDFDGEQLRPYFSMQRVLDGMFELFSSLYGISICPRDTYYVQPGEESTPPEGAVEVWHEDVLFYDLFDVESQELLGSFYADWYPRETKRAGAWMDCLSCGLPPMNGASRSPHIGLMCGNMSKPIGDCPALLTHDEVETVFHEFGHLLHQLLSDVEVRSLAGCNVAWDFVELPSQINENWTWEPEALLAFARHWETGKALPDTLLSRMLAARNAGAASFAMRQLSFGKLDLELHVNTGTYLQRGVEKSLDAIDRDILANYRIALTEQAPSMLRSFSHIFNGGYESGYYSYKWAEMLEADAFSRFKEEGIFNEKTGRDFRRCILAKGNSKPAGELYFDFMQREPDADAMLRRDGILGEA